MDCFIISYISSQRKLYLIAILVNNAFKTVQQRVKDKEDICRRADAQQRYLTQDFTLWWTGLRCVILEDRYSFTNHYIILTEYEKRGGLLLILLRQIEYLQAVIENENFYLTAEQCHHYWFSHKFFLLFCKK